MDFPLPVRPITLTKHVNELGENFEETRSDIRDRNVVSFADFDCDILRISLENKDNGLLFGYHYFWVKGRRLKLAQCGRVNLFGGLQRVFLSSACLETPTHFGNGPDMRVGHEDKGLNLMETLDRPEEPLSRSLNARISTE